MKIIDKIYGSIGGVICVSGVAGILFGFTVGYAVSLNDRKRDEARCFVLGFDKGVRYGLVAHLASPEEEDIDRITGLARWWMVRVEMPDSRILRKHKRLSQQTSTPESDDK